MAGYGQTDDGIINGISFNRVATLCKPFRVTRFIEDNNMCAKSFTKDQRPYSSVVVDGIERAPSRAMLRAVGFKDADF